MKKVAILLCLFLAVLLTACVYTKEDLDVARKEGYSAGFDDGYKAGYAALKPITRPASGTILSGKEYSGAEITVTADSDRDYVVSLREIQGRDCIVFYVRAGDTVTIGVNKGFYHVYFASGTQWYGYGQGLMFGGDTVYSKDDDLKDFILYSWEYTLKPVTNGNFSETPIDESDFFN